MKAHLAISVVLSVAIGRLPSARAAELESVSVEAGRRVMDEIDATIGLMKEDLGEVAAGYQAPLRREAGRLQRRLREAEVQALLGDHHRAAIVLFDVAERPELKTDPQYPEAMFLLAESLRKSGQPRAARRYYEEVARGARGERLAQTVLGLLEVASDTGNFSGVERYVNALKASSATTDSPRIDFTYGKALFRGAATDVTRLSLALERFRAVPPNTSVSAPAAYYAGVTLVRMGRLEEAVRSFERTLALADTHPEAAQIRELAYLSLGRVHQELGDVSESLDAYQGISKDSPRFADMLYEVAWARVKAAKKAETPEERRAEHARALDALELLVAAEPDARLYPDAKVLLGNLQIRLGAPESAYDTFEGIVDQYGDARAELEQLLASRSSAREFFDDLVRDDLEDLGSSSLVSPLVTRFALDDPRVARAVEVRRDLAETDEDLEDARDMVRTLEAALQSEQRFGMFPGLRDARIRALSVQNRLLTAEQRLLELERGLILPHVDARTRDELDAARARARQVEQDVATLPTTDEGIAGSRQQLEKDYEKVSHRTFSMLQRVRGMRAQLAAVKLWMKSGHEGAREGLSPEARALSDERMTKAAAEIAALEQALEGLADEAERAALLSRGDGGWARAERLRTELSDSIDEQEAILRPARAGLPSEKRGLTARIDQQRAALKGLERDLLALQARLERAVDARVDEVRKQVLEVLNSLESERSEHRQLASRAEMLLDPVAKQTVKDVGDELRELVLEADVGILDVAWARKRAHTEKVTELVRELRRRSTELEDEFSGVLEDE